MKGREERDAQVHTCAEEPHGGGTWGLWVPRDGWDVPLETGAGREFPPRRVSVDVRGGRRQDFGTPPVSKAPTTDRVGKKGPQDHREYEGRVRSLRRGERGRGDLKSPWEQQGKDRRNRV